MENFESKKIEIKENIENKDRGETIKNKINDKHRLIFWTAFFYIVIMGIIIYCFMTDFSNVQEYVYSEF